MTYVLIGHIYQGFAASNSICMLLQEVKWPNELHCGAFPTVNWVKLIHHAPPCVCAGDLPL